jgi:hypothetical protein
MDAMEAVIPLDWQLVAQTLLYFTSVALGLVIAVPTGVISVSVQINFILNHYGSLIIQTLGSKKGVDTFLFARC